MLAFLIIIVYSKHLHIFLAPINVSRQAAAEGARPAAAGPARRASRSTSRTRPEDDQLRAREGRGLHLEGHARLRHLHRVRPLPVAVPGVEHRQAAVAQAGDHGPARPPVRQGALPASAARRPRRRATIDFAGPTGGTAPRSAGVRLRPGARVRAGAGRAPAGRDGRGGRRDRPGRAVVVHHLRGLRRAVPGRHRARRPHRRHAPLPGADRVGVPLRARHAVPQPGEQGQPVGAERPQPAGLDEEPGLRRARCSTGSWRRTTRVPVLGRLRGRVRRQGAEDRAGHRGAAAPRRRGLRRARPGGDLHRRPGPAVGQRVPVPDAGGAERRGPQRRVRGPRSRARARSSPPARTASTPWAASTRSSTALRGRAPHPAAQHAGPRGPARPGRGARRRPRT